MKLALCILLCAVVAAAVAFYLWLPTVPFL